jgi:hypothetical protein
LLGPRYPGYFKLGDERALARLITRAATDAKFYRSLEAYVRKLRPMVAPQAEARALLAALKGLPASAGR